MYRKHPNISPGLIFVSKHFLVGLYMEGLMYRWAYIRNGESVSTLVGLYMGGLYSERLIFGGLQYVLKDINCAVYNYMYSTYSSITDGIKQQLQGVTTPI